MIFWSTDKQKQIDFLGEQFNNEKNSCPKTWHENGNYLTLTGELASWAFPEEVNIKSWSPGSGKGVSFGWDQKENLKPGCYHLITWQQSNKRRDDIRFKSDQRENLKLRIKGSDLASWWDQSSPVTGGEVAMNEKTAECTILHPPLELYSKTVHLTQELYSITSSRTTESFETSSAQFW